MLEEKFATVFSTFENYRIKTNLIHNSAINLYMCVDSSWHIDEAVGELRGEGFDVDKTEGIERLTIRSYTDELYRRYAFSDDILIKQTTPHSLRLVRKSR